MTFFLIVNSLNWYRNHFVSRQQFFIYYIGQINTRKKLHYTKNKKLIVFTNTTYSVHCQSIAAYISNMFLCSWARMRSCLELVCIDSVDMYIFEYLHTQIITQIFFDTFLTLTFNEFLSLVGKYEKISLISRLVVCKFFVVSKMTKVWKCKPLKAFMWVYVGVFSSI